MSVSNSCEGMETGNPIQVFTLIMTLKIHLLLHALVVYLTLLLKVMYLMH